MQQAFRFDNALIVWHDEDSDFESDEFDGEHMLSMVSTDESLNPQMENTPLVFELPNSNIRPV